MHLRSKLPTLALLLAACATTPPAPTATPVEPAASTPAQGVTNASATTRPAAPVAKRVPHPHVHHGETLQDDYFWLREKESPEVRAYLEAEDAYTQREMKPTEALQQRLYAEMLGRIQETDLSVPSRKGGYLYYSRTEAGRQYETFCRKKGDEHAPEEVILDVNALAEGHAFMHTFAMEVSDDGRYLAYSVDTTGFRQFELHVKDLLTGKTLPERMEKTLTVAWAADNRTLFYTTEDAAKRQYRIWRHVLGTPAEKDVLVYEEKDERFSVYVARTRSGEWLTFASQSLTTSEVRVVPARAPTQAPRVLAAREQEHLYDVDHHGSLFYIRTNSGGRNFRIVTAPVTTPDRAHWKEWVPHRADVMVEGIDLFQGHLVVYEREGGLMRLSVTDLKTKQQHRVALPEAVYALWPTRNFEWNTRLVRFRFESPITPTSFYDYDMAGRKLKLLKQQPVLGGFDGSRYQTEQQWVTAKDGTRIPVDLTYRKGLVKDGHAPMVLTGYGSYGLPLDPYFDSNAISLLDRGVVLATAHVRGGGEMGKPWHDQGRMQKKMNTFTDFIQVAEALIAQGYTSRERLGITGASAGGLLMGAVVNLRPDLFKAVVANVPFVDVINTMSDASLPLTVSEFEEWGNPQVKDEYLSIRRYCPYTNVEAKDYPAMLVRTSFNDSQVMYFEPAKWVAKLRALKTDNHPLLFNINMNAGHGGASGRYDALREDAFIDAFLLTQLGVEKTEPTPVAGAGGPG